MEGRTEEEKKKKGRKEKKCKNVREREIKGKETVGLLLRGRGTKALTHLF